MARFVLGLLSLLFACTADTPPETPTPTLPGTPTRYVEPHRPQYHFSPPSAWMNDPNGMVYHEGEYHLFYQHYPDSTVWGPMHWGHAVSPDLVHWEHLPIALYPDSLGYIFSGSAVIDTKNTSGLGRNGRPPMVALFTHHDPRGERAGRTDFQYQSLAYSLDKGRTWTKYAYNPVIANPGAVRDFRDPKVGWDERRNEWVMVLAAGDHIQFWTSPDLLNWSFRHAFGEGVGAHGGVWECPDLFRIRETGSGREHWALLVSLNAGGPNGGSGTQYFVGDWTGERFVLDPDFAPAVRGGRGVWLDYGRDNYAGVTWSNVPGGRRLFMGWMSNWDYAQVVPTDTWRSAMTLPRELTLHTTPEGLRLRSQPAGELTRLRGSSVNLGSRTLTDTLDLRLPLAGKLPLLEADVLVAVPEAPTTVYFELTNEADEVYRIGYRSLDNAYFSDRTGAGTPAFSEKFAAAIHPAPRARTSTTVPLRLFFDRSSVELFGGETALTDLFFPGMPFTRMRLIVEGAPVRLERIEFWELQSIW